MYYTQNHIEKTHSPFEARTTRLQNSFFNQAIRIMNKETMIGETLPAGFCCSFFYSFSLTCTDK